MKFIFLTFLSMIVLNSCCDIEGEAEEAKEKTFNTRYKYMEYDTFPKKLVETAYYDENGNMTERLVYDKSIGLVSNIRKYTYDSLNRVTESVLFTVGSEQIYKWFFFYSKKLDSINYYLFNKHISSDYYSYDQKGLLVEQRNISFEDDDFNRIVRYYYNSLDSIVKEEEYISGELNKVDTFYYEKGKKVQKEIYPNIPIIKCGSQSTTPINYSYEYRNEFLILSP